MSVDRALDALRDACYATAVVVLGLAFATRILDGPRPVIIALIAVSMLVSAYGHLWTRRIAATLHTARPSTACVHADQVVPGLLKVNAEGTSTTTWCWGSVRWQAEAVSVHTGPHGVLAYSGPRKTLLAVWPPRPPRTPRVRTPHATRERATEGSPLRPTRPAPEGDSRP